MMYLTAVGKSYSQSADPQYKTLQKASDLLDSSEIEQARELYNTAKNEYCRVEFSADAAGCIKARIGLIDIARRLGSLNESQVQAKEALKYLDRTTIKNESYHRLTLYRYLVLDNLTLNKMETAREWANVIQDHIQDEEDWRVLALSKLTLGDYEDVIGNYNEAIDQYADGIDMAQKVDSAGNIGRLVLQLHNNLGVSYKRTGQLEKAKTEYEKSLDLIHAIFGYQNRDEAITFNNLGSIYYSKGDIGLAAEYFQRAVDTYKSLAGDYSGPLGASLNNLAVTQYMLGNYDLSATYFEEAQRIKEENLGLDHPDTAVGYSNLAQIHILNEDYEAALKNYERSITVRENVYGSIHPNLIEPKISLGNLYSQQLNQQKKAREQYESALAIALNRLGETHPQVTDVYLQLSNSYMADGMYTESYDYVNNALENLYGAYDFEQSFDPERPISDPVSLLRALTLKSQILKYRGDSVDIEDYKESLMALRWAADLVDMVQKSFKNEASKLQLIEKNYSIYTGAVELLSSLYDETGDARYLDQIFETIEKSRSRVTLELIQKVNASKFAGVPSDIIEKEENLNSRITDLQQELYREENQGFDSDELIKTALRDSIFRYKRDLDNFTAELEEIYPSYYNLKYDQTIINRADAQSLLQRDEVVLSYVLGNEDAYVLIVTKKNVNFVKLGKSSGIEKRILDLKEHVLNESTEAYKQEAFALYERLIKPVKEYITGDELIIMADQALHYLPFEMLLKEIPDHSRFSSYPFLIHDYVFSYIPSLTLLNEMDSRLAADPKNLLALAPFSSDVESGDVELMDHQYSERANPLYLTQYEAVTISAQFRDKASLNEYFSPHKTKLLLGDEATYSRFSESNLMDFDYIHFATHAFINEENPEFSAILLYPEKDNSGATFVGDIFNLELDANLVVLGACQTALGSIYKGEGMIGFTRAFIYAGASNLAVSMWRVSDQPTAYLMIDFYDYMRQGYDYSDALRKAKLNLISNPQFANPVNWAAFTLTGR